MPSSVIVVPDKEQSCLQVTPIIGVRRVFGPGYQITLQLLILLTFFGGSVLAVIFSYTFWIFFAAMQQALALPVGRSFFADGAGALTRVPLLFYPATGWPLDAGVTAGVIVTWCVLYLVFDHLALWCNGRGRALLWQRVQASVPVLPTLYHFVEIRPHRRIRGFPGEIGWLLVYPDRLELHGDRRKVILKRACSGDNLELHPDRTGLGATLLRLPLRESPTPLLLLARDSATRLSDTACDASRLYGTLSRWLSEPAPQEPGR